MSSPFVCEICGEAIQIGRHGSGWRHASGGHSNHRVKKIAREEYRKRIREEGIGGKDSQSDGEKANRA